MPKFSLIAACIALSANACERASLAAKKAPEPTASSTAELAGEGTLHSNLDDLIAQRFRRTNLVGLEAILIKRGRIVYQKGFGYADLASKTPVTGDTVFRVASVSKVFTLTALLRLVEAGKCHLDDDINTVLPFSIRHPQYPDKPITYRMLLTHSASIDDNFPVLDPLWNMQGDATTPLAALIADYFSPEGRSFSRDNFLAPAPGTTTQYSNMGIALVGYLVQLLGGHPFAEVVQTEVTKPLGLDTAAWTIPEVAPPGGTATPYEWNPETKEYLALPQYGYPDVPAGMLRLSGVQLAKFMMMYAAGGSVDGVHLLKRETVTEVERAQVPALDTDQALLLHYMKPSPHGLRFIGHNGIDPGVAAEMHWALGDPNGFGMLLLANTEAETGTEQQSAAFHELLPLLAAWSDKL